jgi:hypothetical protein
MAENALRYSTGHSEKRLRDKLSHSTVRGRMLKQRTKIAIAR